MKIALLPTRWRLPSVGAGVVPGPFKGVEECDSSLSEGSESAMFFSIGVSVDIQGRSHTESLFDTTQCL